MRFRPCPRRRSARRSRPGPRFLTASFRSGFSSCTTVSTTRAQVYGYGPGLSKLAHELGQAAYALPEIGVRAGQADPDGASGHLPEGGPGRDRDAPLAQELEGEVARGQAAAGDV